MTDEEIINAVSKVVGIDAMTVNERLWETGLMAEFDNAMKNDRNKARRILSFLRVDTPSIDKIAGAQ